MNPESIGRYEIIRELGRGAMGIVYEARDPNIERRVALKVVRTDLISANKDDILRRFKNEAKAAGNLNHPNIVTIYDAGEHDGLLFIAMEYIEGTTLQAMLAQQGRVPPEKVVEIMRQVCAGLDFAHTRGIVHRDVKPANVMMTGEGLVKITDFGIARVGDGMTVTGQVVGTPNYMSPEQVLGKQLDGRSDLFSVGVMLYEMVTGERPFEGQSITTIMYKIVHEEPIAPRKLDSTIHPGMSGIIERALSKSPEGRQQSGAELAAALENYRLMGTGAPGDPDATASYTMLPGTAALATTAATAAMNPPTQPGAYPTIGQAPATAVPEKKRGFSPVLLGCLGVVALSIISVTIIAIVSTVSKGDKGKKQAAETAIEEPAEKPQPPSAPVATSPGAVVSKDANSGAVMVRSSPPQPEKTTAALQLDSMPPGAQILIDGKDTEKSTPAKVNIARGQHSVAVKLPGFQEASAKFKVKGGEEFEFAPRLVPLIPGMAAGMPRVRVDVPDVSALQGLKGLSERQKAELKVWDQWGAMEKAGRPNMLVNSHPTGAQIYVNGNDTGLKTPSVIPEQPGKYKVRVEHDGFAVEEQEVTVDPGRGPTMVTFRLKPKQHEPPQR